MREGSPCETIVVFEHSGLHVVCGSRALTSRDRISGFAEGGSSLLLCFDSCSFQAEQEVHALLVPEPQS